MDEQLQRELISMQEEDQRILQELINSGELGESGYHPRMKYVHEKNTSRIKEIIDRCGWPGISLVGEEGTKAAWLIVQHAVLDTEFMSRCLALLEKAVEIGEAKGWCFAYLKDRVLTMSHQPQIYGTQHDIDESGKAVPLPIAEPEKVDQLRSQMGLGPLSEATKRIQAQYDETVSNRGARG